MAFWFPGWPGPLTGPNGKVNGIPGPALPVLPMIPGHPGGFQAPGAAPSPLQGLAAYGVPLNYTEDGHPVLQAPSPGNGPMIPPDVPGMPTMPTPPDFLLGGGPQGGGLFQPLPPVAPFNQGRQV